MSIGREIENLRVNHLGLSQVEFARALYKNQRTISAYERGIITPPMDFLCQMSERFNIKIEVTANSIKLKEMVDLEQVARKEIYNFIIENLPSEDFRQEELMSYQELIDGYRELLPKYFEEGLEELGLDKNRVVAAISNDEFAQLCIYYMGDYRANAILYASENYNREWDDKNYKVYLNDTNCIDRYTFEKNDLWAVYTQRNIETMTKEELTYAFYSSILSLLIFKDNRIENINSMDIQALKEYTQDYSLNKEYIDAVVEKHRAAGGSSYIRINRVVDGNYDPEHRDILDYKLIKIPSSEIIVCANDSYHIELPIIVKSEYYKNLKILMES